MSIIYMLFRKMAKNRWLVLSLLTGMILCTAMTSSMPMYTNAIFQRMLIKEMDRSYQESGRHPSRLYSALSASRLEMDVQGKAVHDLDQFWDRVPLQTDGLDPIMSYRERTSWSFQIVPADPTRVDPDERRRIYLTMRTDLADHVQLVDGRMPASEPVDGVYEALVTDNSLVKLKMVLGNEFIAREGQNHVQEIRIKPVGVIAEKDLQDLYWNQDSLRRYDSHFFLDETLFERDILGSEPVVRLSKAFWYATYKYDDFTLDDAANAIAMYHQVRDQFRRAFATHADVSFPLEETLESYTERQQTLQRFLWSLNVPLYILLAFYLYVISNLIVDRQKPEIAVLRSRGASRFQIIMIFAAETSLIALAAFALGPLIGQWFARIIGSTDTFMGFVQRTALRVEMSGDVFVYAGLAALAAFLLNLIPVILATRVSIVDQKRQSARQNQRSFWHTLGLDFIFIGLALYGLYLFRKRIDDMVKIGLRGGDLEMDPLLFAVPSLFILGLGLLLLRIYPYLVRLIHFLGRKRWSPPLYSTLLLVGRHGTRYHALMIFLILTVGTGVFNASAARTINGNMEEQIWYSQGADIVFEQRWIDDAPSLGGGAGPQGSAGTGSGLSSSTEKINYLEPPFAQIEHLPGISSAARVFIKEDGNAWYKDEFNNVRLMGIDTDRFGETSWMKPGLLPHHYYEYLNLMAGDPYAVLVSQSMADEWGVQPGDLLYAGWPEAGRAPFRVYGIVEYFPGFNPNPARQEEQGNSARRNTNTQNTSSRITNNKVPMLVVAHLPTIHSLLRVEPYEVWLKLDENSDRQALLDAMKDNRITVTRWEDTHAMITASRNDPFRMAMNGMMSLGFVLSLCVSFMGFMIYWVLSLQGRMLQLGIFRAMGISFAQLVNMLGVEQLLTSGAGFLIGLSVGISASRIYVPMFQTTFDPGTIVPPFEVMIRQTDTMQLAALIVVMLGAALIFLSWLLSRMKIHQAVKLGED